jgi:oligopeptide transport system permease protein
MAKPNTERWQFGTGDMEKILTEVTAHKGESLWQDAWRRLRRNRSAFYSFVFLVLFGLTSFLAPLLPIASPVASSLQEEPQPPSWPWDNSQLDAKPGSIVTSSLGAVVNNGWRHRSTITMEIEGGMLDTVATELSVMIEDVSGRTTAINRAAATDEKPARLYFGIPNEFDDTPRTDYQVTGNEGQATFYSAPGGAWIELDIPIDESLIASWSTFVYKDEGTFYLFPIEGNQAGLKYEFELSETYEGKIRGVTLNGRDLPANGSIEELEITHEVEPNAVEPVTWDVVETDESTVAIASLADLPMGDPVFELLTRIDDTESTVVNGLALTGDARVILYTSGKETNLFSRQTVSAVEHQGTFHEDLSRKITAGLKSMALPDGVTATLVEVESEDGYTWDMGAISEWMMRMRADIFGLWQTGNWMGVNSKGQDIFSRIVWGSRTSLMVALIATLCSLLIGVTYGAFSGYMGGRIDNAMMRFVDILYSLPFIFVVIFLITVTSEYKAELESLNITRETIFYIVIGAIYWLTMARVVRGQVLSLKNAEFIEAAKVLGASTPRILFVHLVPNVLSIVIVYLTLTIPAVMLFEAFLSFLGMGIELPKVSWGSLAVEGTEAINPLKNFWWLVLFPAMAMGSTLLALNILGDGLRDALDPKLRGKD